MGSDRAPDLPALPRDEAGAPVFQAPWEAQAFAMVVRLREAGHLTWAEWDAAAWAAPHGQPIELSRGRPGGS